MHLYYTFIVQKPKKEKKKKKINQQIRVVNSIEHRSSRYICSPSFVK